MKLNVYVDGFNLYYGSLKGTAHRWLDLVAFCRASFPEDEIDLVRYFNAAIPINPHKPDKATRQKIYWRALRTSSNLVIHEGSYIRKPVRMPLHPIPNPPQLPTIVKVVKSEEKGSDVNLASHLLVDAFEGDHEGVVVISNDSDLAEPVPLVRTKFKKRVIVLHPCSRPGRGPSIDLRKAAALRAGKPALIVAETLLAASQFPPTMTDGFGTIHKPAGW